MAINDSLPRKIRIKNPPHKGYRNLSGILRLRQGQQDILLQQYRGIWKHLEITIYANQCIKRAETRKVLH